MAISKESFVKAIEELKKNAPRKNFVQTVDLLVNLIDIDIRKTPVSISITLPHPTKENKICAFLEKKTPIVDKVIVKAELMADWPKNEIKRLSRHHDIFVSAASLMPMVAAKFGRILGAAGKMPNPKTGGVIMIENETEVNNTVKKLRTIVNIKAKENSIKTAIGKENGDVEKIAENALTLYNAIMNALPNKKENIRSVMIKLTMSKPIKLKEK